MNKRLVLKKADNETAFGHLSVIEDWLFWGQRDDPLEAVYINDEVETLRVVYVQEDPYARCSYAIVSGEDMDAGCQAITRHMEVWTQEELFQAWKAAPTDTEQILAIMRIGVAAPFDYDEAFAERLREGVRHSDPAVRENALAAVGYRDWKEFDSVLSEVADHDPEVRCRNRAAKMLEIRERERASSEP